MGVWRNLSKFYLRHVHILPEVTATGNQMKGDEWNLKNVTFSAHCEEHLGQRAVGKHRCKSQQRSRYFRHLNAEMLHLSLNDHMAHFQTNTLSCSTKFSITWMSRHLLRLKSPKWLFSGTHHSIKKCFSFKRSLPVSCIVGVQGLFTLYFTESTS